MSSADATPLPAAAATASAAATWTNATVDAAVAETKRSADRQFTEQLFFVMLGVVATIVCFLGLVGNIMNAGVLALLSRKWRSPTYTILLALSFADLTIMIVYLTFSLTFFVRRPPVIRPADVPADASDFSVFLYYTWTFAINIAVCASNWLVVAVTFFRFLAVYFPMKVGVHCTLPKVRVVIAVIFVLSAAVVLPDTMTLEMYRENGTLRARDTDLYNDQAYVRVYYTLQHVLLHAVPYALNGVLVTLLIVTLCRSGRWLRDTVTKQACSARKSDQRHVSAMLVVMVLWSMTLTTPTFAYRIYRDHVADDRATNENKTTFMAFRAACDLAELINYASNFYLFCLCNPSYRQKLASLLATNALLKGALATRASRTWTGFSRKQISVTNHQHHTLETSASLLLSGGSRSPDFRLELKTAGRKRGDAIR